MLRRRILTGQGKIIYPLITVDVNTNNAAEVQSWLQSKGYWNNKRLHLNKCVGARPNNQFFTYRDSIYDTKRVRSENITSFDWASIYDLVLRVGDEYLIYDTIQDLEDLHLLIQKGIISEFHFDINVGNCAVAKNYLDILIGGTGVLSNTNAASRKTQYDALTITFVNGPSTTATRYGAGTPTWGSSLYNLNTYPEDTWVISSGELRGRELYPTFANKDGLGLSN